MTGTGEWGDEWTRWATTGGDEAKAFHGIIDDILGVPHDDVPEKLIEADSDDKEIDDGCEPDPDLEQTMEIDLTDDGPSDAAHGNHRTVKKMVAVVLAGGALVACGTTAWAVHSGSTAQSACDAAAQSYQASLKRSEQSVKQWNGLGTDPQDDASTLDKTRKAAAQASKPDRTKIQCPAGDRRALTAAADSLTAAARSNDDRSRLIDNGIGEILRQRATRGLTQTVGAAKELYGSSNGNVADENTRSDLQKQIEAAERLLNGRKTDEGDLKRQEQALSEASNRVTLSMQAKTAADAQAQENQPAAPEPSPAAPAPVTPAAPPKPQQQKQGRRNSTPAAPSRPTAPSAPQGGGGWYVPPSGDDNTLPNHL